MKKTILFSILALSLFTMSCNKETVTQDMEDTVYQMYPNATGVEWDIERKYITADFMVDGVDIEMTFVDGRWTKIKTETTFSNLPEVVKTSHKSGEYTVAKGWNTKDEADIVRTAPNDTTYLVDVEEIKGNKDYELTYNAAGKFISKRKD